MFIVKNGLPNHVDLKGTVMPRFDSKQPSTSSLLHFTPASNAIEGKGGLYEMLMPDSSRPGMKDVPNRVMQYVDVDGTVRRSNGR